MLVSDVEVAKMTCVSLSAILVEHKRHVFIMCTILRSVSVICVKRFVVACICNSKVNLTQCLIPVDVPAGFFLKRSGSMGCRYMEKFSRRSWQHET